MKLLHSMLAMMARLFSKCVRIVRIALQLAMQGLKSFYRFMRDDFSKLAVFSITIFSCNPSFNLFCFSTARNSVEPFEVPPGSINTGSYRGRQLCK